MNDLIVDFRRICTFISIILFAGLLIACQKTEDRDEEGVQEEEIFPTSAIYPSKEPAEEVIPHLSWGACVFSPMSEDTFSEINRILLEKGVKCQIDFVPTGYVTDSEYQEWFQKRKEDGTVPDILSTGIWDNTYSPMVFAKENLLPLDEYFNTEAGEKLWRMYSASEWKAVTFENNVYSMPRLFRSGYNTSVCISVNRAYESYFQSFDGTYASLKTIYQEIGDPNLCIVFEETPSERMLNALFGFSTARVGFAFDSDKERSVNLLKEVDIEAFFRGLYEDIKDGIAVFSSYKNVSEKDILVIIHEDYHPETEFFSEHILAEDLYDTILGNTYGIYNASKNKELAVQILEICYSDPELASLLYFGRKDVSEWENNRAILKAKPEGILAGFVLNLPDEQRAERDVYEDTLMDYCWQIYLTDPESGQAFLNSDYEDYLEARREVQYEFDDLFEAIDGALEKWFDENRRDNQN